MRAKLQNEGGGVILRGGVGKAVEGSLCGCGCGCGCGKWGKINGGDDEGGCIRMGE